MAEAAGQPRARPGSRASLEMPAPARPGRPPPRRADRRAGAARSSTAGPGAPRRARERPARRRQRAGQRAPRQCPSKASTRPPAHRLPRQAYEIVIVPFMLGWIVQWNGYVPALVKTRMAVPPLGAMLAPIVHEPSSSPTLCGTSSLFVHVITSPTLALMGCDQVRFWTV